MMLYPAMSDLLAQVPSRYQLVNVVAARARKIAAEAKQQEIVLDDKPVSIAIREIAQGDVLAEMPEIIPDGPEPAGEEPELMPVTEEEILSLIEEPKAE